MFQLLKSKQKKGSNRTKGSSDVLSASVFSSGMVETHIGSFAQNSFQIDSIFEKVAILTQYCYKYLFFNAKTNEGEIGLHFKIIKKNTRECHKSKISQRNLKTIISTLLLLLWGVGTSWVSKEAVLYRFGPLFSSQN